jgi:hypothetical protein
MCEDSFTPAERLALYNRKQLSMLGAERKGEAGSEVAEGRTILGSDFGRPPEPVPEEEEKEGGEGEVNLNEPPGEEPLELGGEDEEEKEE